MSARRWLIWSAKKRVWWSAGQCGYTADARQAGLYSDGEALAIVERMNWAPDSGAAGRDGAGDSVEIVPATARWLGEEPS